VENVDVEEGGIYSPDSESVIPRKYSYLGPGEVAADV